MNGLLLTDSARKRSAAFLTVGLKFVVMPALAVFALLTGFVRWRGIEFDRTTPLPIVLERFTCEAEEILSRANAENHCAVEQAVAQYKLAGFSFADNLQDYTTQGDWLNFGLMYYEDRWAAYVTDSPQTRLSLR